MPADLVTDQPGVLRATLYGNQRLWLLRLATGQTAPPARHDRIWRSPLLTAAQTGRTGVVCLTAPAPPEETLAALGDALAWLRSRECGDVLVWSTDARPDLALPLAAHGLDSAFVPHWMARPLAEYLPRGGTGVDIDIHLADDGDLAALRRSTTIPYVNVDQFASIAVLLREPVRQRRVWMLVARERDGTDARVLGQAIVNLCDGPAGRFAGLYNLAVDSGARRHGIGKALTTAACNLARDLGAGAIGLNATPDGEHVYRGLGFDTIGEGQTWFLPGRRLANPPREDLVALALAIMAGRPGEAPMTGPLSARLPNGETPLAFAARAGSAEAARWLIDHGAPPEIVPLWALGLREETTALLADPEAVNRRTPPLHTTPLHEAIFRGDTELARLLIEAGADLEAQDDRYRSTPLGWAEALGQDEIAAMIRASTL